MPDGSHHNVKSPGIIVDEILKTRPHEPKLDTQSLRKQLFEDDHKASQLHCIGGICRITAERMHQPYRAGHFSTGCDVSDA